MFLIQVMRSLEDTIAAIATPQGEGGIGIIRISGESSINIAAQIFKGKKPVWEFSSHRLYYGDVINPLNNSIIDKCLLTIMRAPRSYTGENLVEINCHGGSLIIKRVLEAVLRCGARAAEPGEFTRRAFLNNRMDLVQAESVIALIRAKTDLSLNIAQSHFSGALSKKIVEVKEDLFNILCNIEAELDFPDEEDVSRISDSSIYQAVKKSETTLAKLLSTYEEGKLLTEGLRVIILGRTNVGKSSLLNCLLKEERAIVTPFPGTTRDVIEEVLNIRGIPVRLMDTAGLREASDEIEEIGIAFTINRLKNADMVLFVADASSGSPADALKLFDMVYDEGKIFITVLNKMDIKDDTLVCGYKNAFLNHRMVEISALLGGGIENLKDEIFKTVAECKDSDAAEVIITNLRHKTAIDKAVCGLKLAQEALGKKLPREFLTIEIKGALDALGELVGETTSDEILERIFSQFCIGK